MAVSVLHHGAINAQLCHDKCSDVAQGSSYSHGQPCFNLQLVKAIQLTGIKTTKLIEFIRVEMGIKIANGTNLRNQITKVRKLIKSTCEDWIVENWQEHVIAVCQSADYCGNIHWEPNNVQHSTSAGSLCIDGAGCTRIYHNRHCGRQYAAVANSTVTKKPLDLVVS